MTNTTECVTDSVVESINKHKEVDVSKCEDDRKSGRLKVGDTVAMLWFNDPNYYAGKLEDIDGQLGFPIEKGIVGFVEDAHHVVKINKTCPYYTYEK